MKDKIIALFDKVSPTFEKLAQNKYLSAISGAMMATLGPILLGSMSLLLMVLPIPGLSPLLASTGITTVLGKIFSVTTNAISLYIAFFMGVRIVKEFLPEDDGIIAGAISLLAFLVMTPIGVDATEQMALPFTWLGPQGIFTAMILGLLTGRVYIFAKTKGFVVKMPDSVPPMVSRVFESLIPTFLNGLLIIILATVFSKTSYGSMHQFIYTIVQAPLQSLSGTLWALIIFSVVQQFLWFFGIHGTNIILPLMSVAYAGMDAVNMDAVMNGNIPPNIIGMAFFNTITWSGLALGLVLLMVRSKSKQYRELGKMALVPALFGITEPVIFGTPLVLNFNLMIPFIFNNSIAIIVAYVLTKTGIVATFTGVAAVFGLPVGLHAASQGKASIIILQLFIQLILSPILWYPWFKMAEKQAVLQEQGE